MPTNSLGAARPQPKTSPQRPGAARIPGSARFQRANGDPTATTCTPEACAPTKSREKFLSRRTRIFALVVRSIILYSPCPLWSKLILLGGNRKRKAKSRQAEGSAASENNKSQ